MSKLILALVTLHLAQPAQAKALDCSLLLGMRDKATRLISGLQNWRTLKRDWQTCRDLRCFVDRSRVGDHYADLAPFSIESKNYSFYDDDRFHQRLKKSYPAEIFTFSFLLDGGEPHVIQVAMIPNQAQHRNMTNAEYATYLVKTLPFKTVKATRMIEIRPDERPSLTPPGVAIVAGRGDAKGHIYLRSECSTKYCETELKTFLHEHGHNVGGYLFSGPGDGIFYPRFWRKVIQSDGGRYPTDYAETNFNEDFAETFAIYFDNGLLGRDNAYLRDNFKARTQVMDLLFSTDYGGLINGGFWDSIRSYSRARINAIGLTGAVAGAGLGILTEVILWH